MLLTCNFFRTRGASLARSVITSWCLLFCLWAVWGYRAAAQAVGDPPAASPPSPTSPAQPRPDQIIVAKINELPIFMADVEQALERHLKGRQVDQQVRTLMIAELLRKLMEERMLVGFIDQWPDRATEAEIDKVLEERREMIKTKDPMADLDKILQKAGMTLAQYRRRLFWETSWSKYVAQKTTREALEKYFEDHHQEFDGSQIRVRHVLFRPVKNLDEREFQRLYDRALAVYQQIQAKELTFDQAVEKYSNGPSRLQNGDLGWIERSGPMLEEFSKPAFGLKMNEVSEPILTQFGVHLIMVTETRGENLKKFDDVLDKVQVAYSQMIMSQATEEFRAAAKVEISPYIPHYEWGTKKLHIPDPKLLQKTGK
ncbi:MAG: peptidylprolyl isomerase [Pirellulales bacterium]|nr:peptidylprolyl isomerase [Pirellulales bacterium]